MAKIILSVRRPHSTRLLAGIKGLEVRKVPFNPGDQIFIYECKAHGGAGAVVGEYISGGSVETLLPAGTDFCTRSCLTEGELQDYAGHTPYRTLYGNIVLAIVKYAEPKPLKDFGIRKAPQSWCYTEGYKNV